MSLFDQIKFNADGLVPAIIQEQTTGRVLMMAWMNRASLETTLRRGTPISGAGRGRSIG